MTSTGAIIAFCALGGLQLLGLLSAWCARLSEGSRCQTSFQRLFLACLFLVGGMTIASILIGSGCWLLLGITLSLMVLTATCDFTRSCRATVW